MDLSPTHQKSSLTLVFPIYNEERYLHLLFREIEDFENNLKNHVLSEIIFVNDASTDNSYKILKNYQKNQKVIISHARNYGHQNALLSGIRRATTDLIITADSDGQHPLNALHRALLEFENAEVDVVYLIRNTEYSETKLKKFSTKIFYKVVNVLFNINLSNGEADFRIMNKKVRDFLCKAQEYEMIRIAIAKKGFRRRYVPFQPKRKTVWEEKNYDTENA